MNTTPRDRHSGLGKVVYSVDPDAVLEERTDAEASETDDVIQEASEESFPASDPRATHEERPRRRGSQPVPKRKRSTRPTPRP